MMRLGYTKDSHDDRDIALGTALGSVALPASASLERHLGMARDQGATNSCVGHAVALGCQLRLAEIGKFAPQLSPLFLYYASRASHQGVNVVDSGTYIRAAIQAVKKIGCPREIEWPFDPMKVDMKPNWSAHTAAHDFRGVRGYYRCHGLEDIRTALAKGLPVVAGWTIPQSFMALDGPEIVRLEDWDGPIAGGHAMAIVGYDDGLRCVRLANSWGQFWRYRGRVWLDYGLADRAMDAWAVDCS